MPYKRVGSKVYKNENGKWKLVGKSTSPRKAEKYLTKLRMLTHGESKK